MAVAVEEIHTEGEKVERWRYAQLMEAQVSADLAQQLAATDEDLHVMIASKKAGASDELLARIFLP